MSSLIKKIIVGVVVIIAIVYAISLATGKSSTPPSSLSQNGITPADTLGGSANSVNNQFLQSLSVLKSIKLDETVFAKPAFGALVDNSIELIQSGNEGRVNPFAPIGADGLSDQGTVIQISMTTPNATSTASVTLSATIVGLPKTGIVERWFEWGPTPLVSLKTPHLKSGAFTQQVTALEPDTTYYVRAVVSIDGKIYSSGQKSFRTPVLAGGI